jgi:tetratricopeptide (TPR) repeat protein
LIDARIGLYNQLGRIYRTTNNHEEAIKAFDEALKICKKTKDSITILNNKANIYKDLQQYELARDQYAIVHAKSRTAVHSLQLAMALDNLGYVQSKIGVPEALNNIIRAKEIRAKQNDLTGLYASYRTLANYYLDRGNNEMANSYANKGYETAKRINSISYIQDALSLSMDIEDNPKVREYKRLTDSISKAKQLAANKNAFIKYNLQEERKKTVASRLLQEKENGK